MTNLQRFIVNHPILGFITLWLVSAAIWLAIAAMLFFLAW